MANRAYLWCTDLEEPDVLQEKSPVCSATNPYYDSRHTIPVAWFFFFQLIDLRMVEVHFRDATWREVRLIAPKEVALKLFTDRQRLLYDTIGNQLQPSAVDHFINLIRNRPGRNLVMDPHEITDNWSDDQNRLNFTRILNTISQTVSVQELIDAISIYSKLNDLQAAELNIIGYTYGDR